MEKYLELSSKYPHFIYQDFKYEIIDNILEGGFTFVIEDKDGNAAFEFFSSFKIEYKNYEKPANTVLDTMVFTLGLMEAISYWKTTCAPKISVPCGHLSYWQINWWRKLYKNGLAEFFYLNDIKDWDETKLEIVPGTRIWVPPIKTKYYDQGKVILPIGGGKDSITSAFLLEGERDIVPLVMNPIQASMNFLEYKGWNQYILITRRLDKKILQMNKDGFLNGHVPFSAILSVYTMIAARMYGIQDIALSNESSANEPTILGTNINHQYSKSLEYELDINEYVKHHLDSDINYFSLLRGLNEYQITKIFSKLPKEVHYIFRSCNKGSKEGVWCGDCPKCMFTYIMLNAHLLYPRLYPIFKKDFMSREEMKDYFLSLTGQNPEKPFECVGTIEEVNMAVHIIHKKRHLKPLLSTKYWDESLNKLTMEGDLLFAYHRENLSAAYTAIVRKKLPEYVLT